MGVGAGRGMIEQRSPELSTLEGLALALYIQANETQITQPGVSTQPFTFSVAEGASASSVAQDLEDQGYIRDERLLRHYMRFRGMDMLIEAGEFDLNTNMSVAEIAIALTDANAQDFDLRIWEGWRVEQIADSMQVAGHADFNVDAFNQQVRNVARAKEKYTFAASIPDTATLEGFLFPDTYRYLPDTSSLGVIDSALANFDRQFTPEMRSQAEAQGLTIYDVVTIASIVEREAVQGDDRPIIAEVYLNRMEIGMRLQADPTTQYGLGSPGNWWPQLNFSPANIEHAYNTYLIEGLPPGPIANPGLASMQAVLNPTNNGYLFFRARCDGSGYHDFSYTYEEHLTKGC